jgi:choline dehydrogenase-like flavoprotein
LFKPEKNSTRNLVASGVEFVVGEKTFTVEAAKEVILSAGTVQTPQILELLGEYFLT